MPSELTLDTLFAQVIMAARDRDPELSYQGGIFKRYRGYLYFLSEKTDADLSQVSISWPNDAASIQVAQLGVLVKQPSSAGISLTCWQQVNVTVGFRQGGEKIALPGRAGRHTLKKLFQEAGIPNWEREHLPLVYFDGQLVAVADRWVSSEVWVNDGAQAVKLEWRIN